jgi:hypothetical protein
MNQSKSSILDVIAAGLLTLLLGGFAVVNFLSGQIIGGVLLTLLALICAWSFSSDLQRGVRAPTDWEWFKLWMLARPVLVVAAGIGLLLLVLNGAALPPSNLGGGLIAAAGLLWAGLVFHLIWQAPHRHESDAAYRRRIRYRGKSE